MIKKIIVSVLLVFGFVCMMSAKDILPYKYNTYSLTFQDADYQYHTINIDWESAILLHQTLMDEARYQQINTQQYINKKFAENENDEPMAMVEQTIEGLIKRFMNLLDSNAYTVGEEKVEGAYEYSVDDHGHYVWSDHYDFTFSLER